MSVDLDRQLREYCRHLDDKQGALSVEDILKRSGLQVIPEPGNQHRSPQLRWIAVAAATLIVVIVGIGTRLLPATDDTPQPADQPTTTSTATTTPTTTTTLASSESVPPSKVRGWPATGGNQPGEYSWDGSRCAGQWCNIGFMHSGSVAIHIGYAFDDASQYWPALPIPELPITDDGLDDGLTAVSVAGHDGIHRRIDDLREEWIVEIEGLMIAIRLIAKPGTSQADLAEAYAIIDSIRPEPVDNYRRFRLVFTLPTLGDLPGGRRTQWDSG